MLGKYEEKMENGRGNGGLYRLEDRQVDRGNQEHQVPRLWISYAMIRRSCSGALGESKHDYVVANEEHWIENASLQSRPNSMA